MQSSCWASDSKPVAPVRRGAGATPIPLRDNRKGMAVTKVTGVEALQLHYAASILRKYEQEALADKLEELAFTASGSEALVNDQE